MKIVKAVIKQAPKNSLSKKTKVWVEYENGINEELFKFYEDEINFHSKEFIGLTREQALDIRKQKDINYLRN